MEPARGEPVFEHLSVFGCSTARMGVVVMMAGFVLMSTVGGQSTNLTSSCDVKYSQGPQITICNITRPYSEVCFSGCCTYTCPPTFLDHLKNRHCEPTWYSPDMTSLADPTQPQNLSELVISVTLQSLITKKHVDGLFIYINCHDTNKRYKAVYRVVSNISGSPPGASLSDQVKAPILGTVSAVAVLFLTALAALYNRKRICSRICRGADQNPGDVELGGGVGGGDPVLEEAQALNLET